MPRQFVDNMGHDIPSDESAYNISSSPRPFFSIAVPTYNRLQSLKQTLLSIVGQTFTDFEVIVGNDNPGEPLSATLLGTDDPRIRIVNNPRNLGELANMNALLGEARGIYFTWQFDDDLYAPDFLAATHHAIQTFNSPSSILTSYRLLREGRPTNYVHSGPWKTRLLTGRQFLQLYLSGKLKAMGCTGAYETAYLRGIGGVERLTNGPFALFSEYLLLLRVGLLERVAYIDAPLVYYLAHQGSWGTTNTEVEAYKQAGENLLRRGVEILSNHALRDDFNQNASSILRLVFHEYVTKASLRSTVSSRREAMDFLASLKTSSDHFKGTDLCQLQFPGFWRAMRWFTTPFLVAKFKVAAPRPLVKFAYKLHSAFRTDRFFRFK